MTRFVFREYTTAGKPLVVRSILIDRFTANGMRRTGTSPSGAVVYFRSSSLFFSSRRPLTCVSDLSLETVGSGGVVRVRIGATFTKVKYYTIAVMGLLWVGIPVIAGLFARSLPEFSPFGGLVVPAGFLLHYSVRGRVFRYLRKTVERAGA